MKAKSTTSTHKKVVVELLEKKLLRGYLNPARLPQAEAIDVLTQDGEHIEIALEKVRAAAFLRYERRADFAIQVEGGIRSDHLAELTQAGADILVAGSAIFNSDDPKARLSEMLRLGSASRPMSKV